MKKLYALPLASFFLLLIFFTFTSCATEPVPQEVKPEEMPTEVIEPIVQEEQEEEVPFNISFVTRLQEILKRGTIDEAIALYDELPPEYENDVELQLLHASLLVSALRLEEATVLTDKLLVLSPDNQEVLSLSIMLSKAAGDKQKKSAAIKQLLAKNPNHPEANVELGNEQMLRRNFSQSRLYFEKALVGDPENEDALSGYGQALYYLGEDKESIATFNHVLEVNPENSTAYSFLGKLAAEDENYKVAADNVAKAIEIDQNVFDYWLDYGQYLRYQGKFAEAEEAWINAKDLSPDYFLGYAYLAGLYDEQNRFTEALEMYRTVIKLNPKYYFAYESLGMFAWHEGNYAEARVAFEKALHMNSSNISYPLMIAATYLKENNITGCRNFLSKQMRNRDITSVEYSLLRLYYDRINANQVAQKVANTSDRNLKGKGLYYLGLFHEINGNDVLSEKYYTDVLNLNSPMFFEYRLAEWAIAEKQNVDTTENVAE